MRQLGIIILPPPGRITPVLSSSDRNDSDLKQGSNKQALLSNSISCGSE